MHLNIVRRPAVDWWVRSSHKLAWSLLGRCRTGLGPDQIGGVSAPECITNQKDYRPKTYEGMIRKVVTQIWMKLKAMVKSNPQRFEGRAERTRKKEGKIG